MDDDVHQSDQPVELFDRDRFAKLADISILEARSGYARCLMRAGPQHQNSLGILHGGAIFTLGDFAFAVASNLGPRATVALDVSIQFIRPGGIGDYIAEARQISLQDKVGSYEVRITDSTGELVALFHGLGYRKRTSLSQIAEKIDSTRPNT